MGDVSNSIHKKIEEGARRARELAKQVISNTSLPEWVVTAIRRIAHHEFCSSGSIEVDGYVVEWIGVFEEIMKDYQR